MICQARSHESYLNFVIEQFNANYKDSKQYLRDFFLEEILWITSIDLSQTWELLRYRYSSNPKGRKPRNPEDMLRSLLLMHKLHITGVDEWVKTTRKVPVYAILCGFHPRSTPGVGTYYDFFKRLWLNDSPHLSNRSKRKLKKPKKKGKKNEKLEPQNPQITEKLVNRALRHKKIHYTPKAHDQLQHLFKTLFVDVSAEKGLFGNTQALSITSDGSAVETGGRAYGKFLCDCRKSGNWKCGCNRQFSDPDANYGWDSYREKYYYGRCLNMVSASDSPYDLPLYPRLYRASKHDAVTFISTLHEVLHWYPGWKIGECILDSAHDAYPIYKLLEQYDVSAIIDLNPRRSKQFTYNEMVVNLDGVPVCPIGRKMIDWGVDKKRYRRKWRCPAKVGKWECPTPCSSSDYGRTFYTSTKDNPRLFPRVKRDSREWKKRYALRTGVERCNKRQKIDYKLEDSKGRSSRHWSNRTYIIAMCQHADAWFQEAKKTGLPTLEQWFESSIAA